MLDMTSRAERDTASKAKPARYHPALVVLHWILAVLILLALMNGAFRLKTTPNSSPEKIAMLGAHMSMGLAILVLMIGRFAVRAFTLKPERSTTGSALLDRIATTTHYGHYAAVALMAVSGIVLAAAAALPAIVFGGSPASLPVTFSDLPPRIVHGVLAQAILALVGVHLLGALYHHLLRKDRLLRRMWFGSRRWRS